MQRMVPMLCPACTERMTITELTCSHCQTRVQGHFDAPGLHRLNADQVQFVEVFMRCRGNIKEVEKDLKISYPTVRSRLDQVIQSMGYDVPPRQDDVMDPETSEALDGLESGELSFEEALRRLKGDANR
jgi:hypothetical protein